MYGLMISQVGLTMLLAMAVPVVPSPSACIMVESSIRR